MQFKLLSLIVADCFGESSALKRFGSNNSRILLINLTHTCVTVLCRLGIRFSTVKLATEKQQGYTGGFSSTIIACLPLINNII